MCRFLLLKSLTAASVAKKASVVAAVALVLLPAFAFGLEAVHAHLLVVLLEGGHVLPGLGELALLHALADVPVDEGALGVHQVELVVEAGPGLGDGGRVGEHADGTLDLGQVAARHHRRRLVVDPDLRKGAVAKLVLTKYSVKP
jgi:hypothetical protein